jgi:CRP/FNR family transcriptional regulator, cyclic AMP receptor protein
MSLKEEAELLRRIPLFAEIEPAKLKLLAFTSERIGFAPGQYLFHQGDMGDAAYILIEGEAAVVMQTAAGPRVVARLGRNDVVGEVAVLGDVPRTASVRAETPLTVLRISKEAFLGLLRDFPQMAVCMMRVVAQRLENTTGQLRQALAEGNGADAA